METNRAEIIYFIFGTGYKFSITFLPQLAKKTTKAKQDVEFDRASKKLPYTGNSSIDETKQVELCTVQPCISKLVNCLICFSSMTRTIAFFLPLASITSTKKIPKRILIRGCIHNNGQKWSWNPHFSTFKITVLSGSNSMSINKRISKAFKVFFLSF